MPDREKVIEILAEMRNCFVMGENVYALNYALALLKYQDPVAPILRPSIKGLAWHCGSCDWKMIEMPDTVTYENTKGSISYCANCGRAVKWDA